MLLVNDSLLGRIQFQLTRLRRWLASEVGLLFYVWCYRTAILVGILWYIFQDQSGFGINWRWIPLAVCIFILYQFVTAVLGLKHQAWMLLPAVKTVQVTFEILFYTALLYLGNDPGSDIYLLYLAPLLLAARFFPFGGAYLAIAGAAAGYIVAVALLTDPDQIRTAYGNAPLHLLVLTGIPFFYAVRRSSRIIEALRANDSPINAALLDYPDGMYIVDQDQRLLFVNDHLQKRHGALQVGTHCTDYFHCAQACAYCPIPKLRWFPEQKEQIRETTFADEKGNCYPVRLATARLFDEGKKVQAVTFVQDLSSEHEYERILRAELGQARHQVQQVTSHKARLLKTSFEVSAALTGMHDLDSLQEYLVQTAAQVSNVESAALFLVSDNRLVRVALCGMDSYWLPEESYGMAEGITGQVLIAKPDSKYGDYQLENNVEENQEVVRTNLEHYKKGLKSHQVRHLLAVPLNGKHRTFGVLRVVNRLDAQGSVSERGFTADDVEMLQTIASLAAVSIENARLLNKLETLYDIGLNITRTLDIDALFQIIVQGARRTLHRADKASVTLIDSRTGLLTAKAVADSANLSSNLPPLRADEGIAGRAIREQRAVYVPDTNCDSEFVPRGAAVSSLIVVPLRTEARVIGTLSLDSSQPDAFTQDDQQLVEMLAAQAAAGVRRAILYQRTQTLNHVSQVINSSLDRNQVFERIWDELEKVVEFDSSSIQLLEDNILRIVDSRGFDDAHALKQITFPIDDPRFPNYFVIKDKRPYIIDDVIASYPHFFTEAETYHSAHIRSLLAVPIISHDRVIGMMSLERTIPNYYTPDEATLALTFANHVAVAVERAELYARLDKEAERKARASLHRDLHDLLNYIHPALVLRSSNLSNFIKRDLYDADRVLQELDLLWRAAVTTQTSVAQIYRDWDHPILAQRGLVGALEQYAELLGLPVQFECETIVGLNEQVEYALYKIAREALSNIRKHAQLEKRNGTVQLQLKRLGKCLGLAIFDNGIGFDVRNALRETDAFGLHNMEHWTRTIGGTLVFHSNLGRGTELFVDVPLMEAQHA